MIRCDSMVGMCVLALGALAGAVLYAKRFEREGWTDSADKLPTSGPVMHQEVISPPSSARPGASWTAAVQVDFPDGSEAES